MLVPSLYRTSELIFACAASAFASCCLYSAASRAGTSLVIIHSRIFLDSRLDLRCEHMENTCAFLKTGGERLKKIKQADEIISRLEARWCEYVVYRIDACNLLCASRPRASPRPHPDGCCAGAQGGVVVSFHPTAIYKSKPTFIRLFCEPLWPPNVRPCTHHHIYIMYWYAIND